MVWKIGYPSGLSSVTNEEQGRALYQRWAQSAIQLSSKSPMRVGGFVNSSGSNYVNGTTSEPLTIDCLNGGFLRFITGVEKGKMFDITDTTTTTILVSGSLGSVNGNYFEAVTGEATFIFSDDSYPTRIDKKTSFRRKGMRVPIYGDAVHISTNRNADDFQLVATFKSLSEIRKLMILLANPVSYDGSNALHTVRTMAPLILEEGGNTANNQYLVHFVDVEIDKQASNAGLYGITIKFIQIDVIYRGF